MSLVLAQTMVSCSEDYEEQVPESKNMSVHLNVSADDMIEVSLSRSYAYDYYAEEGEFINSLCVFIVDESGTIVKKFSTDDDTGDTSIFTEEEQALAKEGNLTNWDSELEDLEAGTYTIYAFANWETTFGEIDYQNYKNTWEPYTEDQIKEDPWYKLISKEVEESITEDDITFATSDVCGKIDFSEGRYIPMSGMSEVTITAEGSNNVNVKLDRLVAKVLVTLQVIDTSNVYTGLELTCSPYCDICWIAEKVWLFPNDEIADNDNYDWGSYITLVEDQKVIMNGNPVYIGYAYVNESDADKAGFSGDVTYQIYLDLFNEYLSWWFYYSPYMKTRNIPRNTVLPLNITCSEYIGYPLDEL